MKKIIIGCLGVLVAFHTAVAAGPYYDLRLWASSATLKTAGTITVENSASTGAATITLAGASGVVTATSFAGLASSATYATTAGTATDSTKVAKAGDYMTGQLTIINSSFTVGGSTMSLGGVPFYIKGGNVGVANTNPSYKLDVTGSGNFSTYLYGGSIFSGSAALNYNDGAVKILDGGQAVWSTGFDLASDVGLVHYGAGNLKVSNASTGWGNLFASSITATNFYGNASTLSGVPGDNLGNHVATTTLQTAYWIDSSSNISAVDFKASGKVGIGLTNPLSPIHIYDGSVSTAIYVTIDKYAGVNTGLYINASNGGAASGDVKGIYITGDNSSGGTNRGIHINSTFMDYALVANGAAPSYFGGAIQSASSITATEFYGTVATAAQTSITSLGDLPLLVVTGTATFPGSGIWNASGNVGIGTTAPTRKLDVQRADDGLAAYALAQGASSATGIEGIATGAGTNVGVLGAANLGTTNTAIGTLAGNPAVGAGNYAINSLSDAQSYFAGTVESAGGFIGSGAALTNIPGDNLGNHIATTTLNMGAFAVVTSSNISAARYQIDGSTVLSVLPGYGSLGLGVGAGRYDVGNYNIASGFHSGYENTTGERNSFYGALSGVNNTSGVDNTLIGKDSGFNIHTGSRNTVLGSEAGVGFTGNEYSSNTLLGYRAGYANTTGSGNTLIGDTAGDAITSGSNNTVIGYGQDTSAAAASNELNIVGLIKGYMASPSSVAVYGSLISTGSMGIGTFDIGLNKLSVRGSGNTYSRTITEGSSNEAGMGVQRISPGTPVQSWTWYLPSTLTDIGLYNTVGAKVVMQITPAGLTGLSTTAPKSTLSVSGNAAIGATYAGTNAAPTNGLIVEGNVGIGTTAPAENLVIKSLTAGTAIRAQSLSAGNVDSLIATNNNQSEQTSISVTGSGYTASGSFLPRLSVLYANAPNGLNFYSAGSTGTIKMFTGGDGTANERMRIDKDGNVGIGTTAPATKLHVNTGTITIDGTGAPTLSYALCLSTAGAMGHCTAAPNANGSCSCVTP